MSFETIAAIAPWAVLLGYCAIVTLFSPKRVSAPQFFGGGAESPFARLGCQRLPGVDYLEFTGPRIDAPRPTLDFDARCKGCWQPPRVAHDGAKRSDSPAVSSGSESSGSSSTDGDP